MSPFIAFLFPFFTLIVSSAVFYNLLSCNSMTLVTTYFQQWSKPAFAVAMCIYILPSSIIVYNVLAFFPFCPPFCLVSYTFYIHFIVRCLTVIFQSELLCSLAFKLVSFPVSMFLLSQIFLFVKSPKCCSSLFLSPSIPFCWTCGSLFGGSTRTTLDDVGRRRRRRRIIILLIRPFSLFLSSDPPRQRSQKIKRERRMMLMLLMLDTENVKAKKRGFFLLLTLGKTKPKSGAFIFAEVHRLSMQPAAKTRPNDLAEKAPLALERVPALWLLIKWLYKKVEMITVVVVALEVGVNAILYFRREMFLSHYTPVVNLIKALWS